MSSGLKKDVSTNSMDIVNGKDNSVGIRFALKNYLQEKDSYSVLSSDKSRSLRNLLIVVGKNCSASQLKKLELMWREIISETLTELISNYMKLYSDSNDLSPTLVSHDWDNSESIIKSLLNLFQKSRRISQFELWDVKLCAMSADTAFETVFRLLSPATAKTMSKLLAMRISGLLDSTKQSGISSRSWTKSVDSVTELIQVQLFFCFFFFQISWIVSFCLDRWCTMTIPLSFKATMSYCCPFVCCEVVVCHMKQRNQY